VVPLLNLEFLESGVGAREGTLVHMEDRHEEPVELPWVWERVFEPGLRRLRATLEAGETHPPELFDADGALRVDDLLRELGQLGGPALVDFAAHQLGLVSHPR
jgi:hypothetical protein